MYVDFFLNIFLIKTTANFDLENFPLKTCYHITNSAYHFCFQIRHLKHNNVFCLNGACVDPLNIYIVSTYYNKGSLLDVLSNTNIKLDWIFKLSFASDIAKVGNRFVEKKILFG